MHKHRQDHKLISLESAFSFKLVLDHAIASLAGMAAELRSFLDNMLHS